MSTAQEIRDVSNAELRRQYQLVNTTDQQIGSSTQSIMQFSAEIAAQLAELNESRKPRWVEFSYNGGPLVLDANDIVGVAVINGKTSITHRSSGGYAGYVDQRYADVCAKLGIPVTEPLGAK